MESNEVQQVHPAWKFTAGILASAVLTGAASWLTFGGDKVTAGDFEKFDKAQRQYVSEQIQKASAESEYARDKAVIRIQLDNNTKNVATLTEQIQAVVRVQSDAAADRKITNAKLDGLSAQFAAQFAAVNTKLDEALRRDGK